MTTAGQIAERFYTAFARRDWRTMQACYHPEAHFRDEVFDLRGAQIGLMWRMLCERGTDLRLDWRLESSDATSARVHWDAHYTFSATGRRVHNAIDAALTVTDGLIVEHIDRFDFGRWSRQALGAPGWLLGWSPMLRRKVQAQAARGLEAFGRATARSNPSAG